MARKKKKEESTLPEITKKPKKLRTVPMPCIMELIQSADFIHGRNALPVGMIVVVDDVPIIAEMAKYGNDGWVLHRAGNQELRFQKGFTCLQKVEKS